MRLATDTVASNREREVDYSGVTIGKPFRARTYHHQEAGQQIGTEHFYWLVS